MDWRAVIREAVRDNGGLATRRQLLERIPVVVLDGHIGRRNLARVLPHVYRLSDAPVDDSTLLRAALLHAGPVAALSHTTALAVWGLRPLERPLHLTVDQGLKRAGAPDVVVHRRLRFDPESSQCVQRHGLRVTALPRTLVDSWPLLPTAVRHEALLVRMEVGDLRRLRRRSGGVKLEAAVPGGRRGGWEQPRQSRVGAALPDAPGPVSETRRHT